MGNWDDLHAAASSETTVAGFMRALQRVLAAVGCEECSRHADYFRSRHPIPDSIVGRRGWALMYQGEVDEIRAGKRPPIDNTFTGYLQQAMKALNQVYGNQGPAGSQVYGNRRPAGVRGCSSCGHR